MFITSRLYVHSHKILPQKRYEYHIFQLPCCNVQLNHHHHHNPPRLLSIFLMPASEEISPSFTECWYCYTLPRHLELWTGYNIGQARDDQHLARRRDAGEIRLRAVIGMGS
ncbi:unnamed protein product, partial [Nesidiocoris tenuis]